MSQYSLKPESQENAWKTLLQLAGKLPQSLLLIGPSGVGKKRSVLALFQALHCEGGGLFGGDIEKPCGTCIQCKKIHDGNHPDLLLISPVNDTIHVDDLREMKKSLYFKPMDGTLRFVIIDEAHKMNATSANTILKTLEEPPAHTRFFLTTHERGLILQTILSRSQYVYFSPLPHDTILRILSKQDVVIPKRIESLVLDLLSGGLSRITELSQDGIFEFLENISSELEKPLTRINWDQVVATSSLIEGSEEKINLMLDVLLRHFRLSALQSVDSDSYDSALTAADIALDSVFLRNRIERNANKKLISLSLARNFSRARQEL